MSRRRRFTVDVIVHPFTPDADRDEQGNDVPGYGADVVVHGCSVAPASSTEPTEPGRSVVVTGWSISGPYDMPVTARDEITLPNGVRCTVQGEVARWGPNPFNGRAPGCQLTVQRVEG